MGRQVKVLYLSAIITILLSLAAIFMDGSIYQLQTKQFAPEAELGDVDIEYSTPGIVKNIDAFSDDDGQTIFVFQALEQGDTHVTIHYSMHHEKGEDFTWKQEVDLKVWWFNLILDRTNGSFSGYDIAIFTIVFLVLLTEVIMLWVVYSSWKRGAFSYSMVTAGSIAIFIAVLLLFAVYKILNNVVKTFQAFVAIVSDIGYLALLLLIPVMLVLSVFLMISNLWLMKHEGRRPVNSLGILFGILWLVGTILTLGPTLFMRDFGLPEIVSRCGVYALCYMECLFISTVACSFLAVRYRPTLCRDYIIILGCGIRKDGTLTPLLRGRVDAALKFEKKQFKKTGKHAIFVPSGGQGPDEVISEGEAMERYLLEQGVEPERILREDQSVNTLQNMQFSKVVIEAHIVAEKSGGDAAGVAGADGGAAAGADGGAVAGADGGADRSRGDIREKMIAFATTNYHIFRGYILSAKCGFDAKGISAKTKTYFYPNAYLREFVGLLVDKRYTHAVNLTCIIVFFLVMEWFVG
ncbi:MAG: YdcF family protein [Eubacterium sp.]|nr:YdcF family protein [Eubacterium sp.]